VALGLFNNLLGRKLSGKWSAFAASFKANMASACPAQGIALGIGDSDDGVVEGSMNVHMTMCNLPLLLNLSSNLLSCHGLLLRLLLASDGLALALSGSGVGSGVLPVNRKAPLVAGAPVAVDFKEAADVAVNLAAKVALNQAVLFNNVPELLNFFVSQVANLRSWVQGSLGHDRFSHLRTNSVDALQSVKDSFVSWQINTGNTSHSIVLFFP